MKWYDKAGLLIGGFLTIGAVGGIERGCTDLATGIVIGLIGLAMASAVVIRSNLVDE